MQQVLMILLRSTSLLLLAYHVQSFQTKMLFSCQQNFSIRLLRILLDIKSLLLNIQSQIVQQIARIGSLQDCWQFMSGREPTG